MSIDIQQAVDTFRSEYNSEPTVIARAPGRVNIIGEHTDYNHGFVLPMAIERETVILARPRSDRKLRAYAANLERHTDASLEHCERNPHEPWIDYLVGVAHELGKLHLPVYGADVVITGDVPVAAGLSSSASLEMAALVMFEALGEFRLDGPEAPKLGRRVENEFLGLSTGIMDQFVVRMAKHNHALYLDCRSLEYEHVPEQIPMAAFVIANTGVSRGLSASKYNERVAECNEAVRYLRGCHEKGGTHLRDFTIEDLEHCKKGLPENVFRRARHVINEIERTKKASFAMRSGEAADLGELMNLSDESLHMDYEVTCPELVAMTEIARDQEGCYGSRMTGAGFGGSTVSLVAEAEIERFSKTLLTDYKKRTGIDGEVIISLPAEGAGLVRI